MQTSSRRTELWETVSGRNKDALARDFPNPDLLGVAVCMRFGDIQSCSKTDTTGAPKARLRREPQRQKTSHE
jgi:hypothetical protein